MNKKVSSLSFGLVILVILVFASYAGASSHLEEEYSFDPGKLEYPEGIAMDKVGNMYVSLGPPFWFGTGLGEVWKIYPDGSSTILVKFDGGPGPAGLAVDARGTLYIAYPTADPSNNGVYMLSRTGETVRLPGSEDILLANGLAFDKQGNVYVTDSAMGAVWRIPRHGSGDAQVWHLDPLLAGCFGLPGANGIAFRQGSFYVANTAAGSIIEIPLLVDGSPGLARVIAGDHDCVPPGEELFGLDGIALDVHGDIYAMLVLQNKMVKIDPEDGSFSTVLTEVDGLYNPASIVFGTGKGDRQRVFFTNFALLPPPPAGSIGPAVLSIGVDEPGQPLP